MGRAGGLVCGMSELKTTPGPWRWEISSGTVRLCGGEPRYDLTVIDFVRKGMNDATVRFRENTPGWNIMHKAQSFAVPAPGREHHEWFFLIDQPDAHLIAAAPDLYAACKAVLNSDMAMREEDEGHVSATLNIVRAALAKARGEAQS